MFRIEVYVDDKKLAEALRALVGVVRGQPVISPVANVEENHPKQQPKAITNGTTLAMFEAYLGSYKSTASLTPQDLRDWLKTNGKSPLSASSLATDAVKARLLKRIGKSSAVHYTVIRKG
jgi:hypothetical protein